jgi:hypothetical protein
VDTNRLEGEVLKQAQVVSNDPAAPNLALQFKGKIKPSITVSPRNRVRFRADRGAGQSWRFEIQSPRKRNFGIERIESRRRLVKTGYRLLADSRNSGAGNVYEVEVTLPPDAPIGRIREVVRIHTDISGAPPAEIALMGTVEGPVRYHPERLTFTPMVAGGHVSQSVDFFGDGQKKIGLRDVQADRSEVQWKTIPVEPTGGYVLVVIWTGPAVEKILKGRITVVTGENDQARIEIPYTVFPSRHLQRKADSGMQEGKPARDPS